jgi:hypothetical protein
VFILNTNAFHLALHSLFHSVFSYSSLCNFLSCPLRFPLLHRIRHWQRQREKEWGVGGGCHRIISKMQIWPQGDKSSA